MNKDNKIGRRVEECKRLNEGLKSMVWTLSHSLVGGRGRQGVRAFHQQGEVKMKREL